MKRLLTSCFGLGFMPIASGTWGSLPPAFIFVGVCLLCSGWGLIAVNAAVMVVLAIIGSVVCVKYTPHVVQIAGKKDPGEIVADEFAGQSVTFIGAYASGYEEIAIVAVSGFLLFRLFDIFKPWPIRKLEKLPDGWGVLADDLLAGLFAGIILNVGILLYHNGYLAEIFDFSAGLTVFKAVILGSVQGLTEFLPVSSSGHLVLFEHFMKLDPETPKMLIFDLITHVGTVFAILVAFRKSIVGFSKNLMCSAKYGKNPIEIYKKSPSLHFLLLAMISTLITGVIGIGFEKVFTSARGNLSLVAAMWCITATLLLATDYKIQTRVSLRKMGVLAAVIIGLAQAGAIMPGISRSGTTICCAVLLGLHRKWAIEYSFMLAMPAILGGTLITLLKDSDQLAGSGISGWTMFAGAAAACVVGIGALKLLIGVSKRKSFKYFAVYCYLLAAVVGIYIAMSN